MVKPELTYVKLGLEFLIILIIFIVFFPPLRIRFTCIFFNYFNLFLFFSKTTALTSYTQTSPKMESNNEVSIIDHNLVNLP